MFYKTDLLFDSSCLSKAAGKRPSKLSAETDAGAIAEAERLLRASRVIAGVEGDEPPTAGVVSKDGQEFVCIIVNSPIPENLPVDDV